MANKKAPVRTLRLAQQLILLLLVLAIIIILFRVTPFITTSSTPQAPTYVRSIYVSKGSLGLKYPQGIASNNKNNWLYVTSAKNSRVFVFDEDYKELFSFGEKVLKVPVFVATNAKGDVYVTDRVQRAVFMFSQKGNFLKKVELSGINNPLAIAIDKKNNIYLSDTGKEHRILKYDPDGKLLLKFGHKKRAVPVTSSAGGFFYPNSIAVDSAENIYVADSNNERIQIFDKNGKIKKMIITGGLPRGISINEKARVIFVVDALRHKIFMYDLKTNKELANFSRLGSGKQDVAFPNASTLKGKDLNELLVVDRENGRIQLYKTTLDITDLISRNRPLLPLIPIPFLGFMLLFLVTRKRKYIVSDCFVESVLSNQELSALLENTKLYSTSTLTAHLKENNLLAKLEGRIFENDRFNHFFADRVQEKDHLTRSQAEALALAHHKGIYQPVLLACDKNLLNAAHEHGVRAMDMHSFIQSKKPKTK